MLELTFPIPVRHNQVFVVAAVEDGAERIRYTTLAQGGIYCGQWDEGAMACFYTTYAVGGDRENDRNIGDYVATPGGFR